jgi:hypothetical protein
MNTITEFFQDDDAANPSETGSTARWPPACRREYEVERTTGSENLGQHSGHRSDAGSRAQRVERPPMIEGTTPKRDPSTLRMESVVVLV